MKEAQLWICYFRWTASGQNQDSLMDNVLISKLAIISDLLLLHALLCTEGLLKISNDRSSRQEVFCKKDVLGNFTKFTCARVSLLIKLQPSANLGTPALTTPLVVASVNDRYEKVLNVEFDNFVFLHWYRDQRDSNSNHLLCEFYCI